MNYGFVINNQRCIGCHACSTACKSENEVPLGVYRTWVKYTETGRYPDTQRHFQVTRCNHCSNPPCVRICPTQAMYQRDDGIVEFDSSACIGCKGCMQACPYDAVHIDPTSGTAAKCHYCSHRVDVGLEPSCVVVCPTHAIIAGDMDDPTSEISRTLAREKVTVRKPEQGTAPKLFYIEGSSVNLHPTATAQGDTFMWADALNHGTIGSGFAESQSQCGSSNSKCGSPQKTSLGVELRAPQTQGDPTHGAIDIGGTRAEQMVQVGYNAQHKVPWHWPVPAYLVTKGLAAGIFLLVALAQLLGGFSLTPLAGSLFSVSTVFLLGLTTVLLVFDLEKPGRFLYILTRPQWRSWLTRGAFFLIGFSLVASLWAAAELLTYLNWLDMAFLGSSREGLFLVGIPLAVMAAIYTAFLFGQAEGRDFWQSPLLPVHLLIQALLMGCAAVLLISGSDLISPELTSLARWTFAFLILLDAFAVLSGEFAMPHASDSAAKAAHAISHGKYKWHFWVGSLAIGHLIPFLFVALAFAPTTAVVAALCSIVGLYSYEYAFVMAPQEVPNS